MQPRSRHLCHCVLCLFEGSCKENRSQFKNIVELEMLVADWECVKMFSVLLRVYLESEFRRPSNERSCGGARGAGSAFNLLVRPGEFGTLVNVTDWAQAVFSVVCPIGSDL